MTQETVLNYLKKHGRSTTKEISKGLGITKHNVSKSLNKLLYYGEVIKIEKKVNWKVKIRGKECIQNRLISFWEVIE